MRQIYDLVSRNKFDYEFALKHNMEVLKLEIKANELPELEERILNYAGKGGCLQFSFALLKKMKDMDIEGYIAVVMFDNPETGNENELHTTVCYKKDGKYVIADPAFAARTGQVFLDVPIEQFAKKYGYPVSLYNPYGKHGDEIALEKFLDYPFAIFNEEGWKILD